MSDRNDKDPNNRDADDIEANIEKTRTQLGDDVEAITYQLSPERYKEQLRQRTEGVQSAVSQGLTDAVDNAGAYSRRASRGFLERLEDDPLPAVLVALGVSVLAIGGAFSASSSEDELDLEYPSDRFPQDRPSGGDNLRNSLRGPDYGRTIGDAPNAGALSGDQNLPTEGVDEYDYTGDGPGYDPIDDEARREAERRAKREAYRAKRGLVRLVGDHPLIAGSIITLAGMAIGLSAPSTRQEDELMGRESDKFKAKAERAAKQAGDVAAKSYERAKETAKEEADRQDLNEGRASTRNAGQKAENVVEEAAKDARETAENEAEKKDGR